jgi:5'-nucleotidase
MPAFLISNDDGPQSPFLPRMVEALRRLGAVRVCVPAEEQSWKAKAMSRWGRIHARPLAGLGVPAFTVTGTPSDCVNLALHHLFPEPVDWVISGINIGWNVGAAFAINSGTVGAALEGALCGKPAVAFSTFVPVEVFQQWATERRLTSPAAGRVLEVTTARMAAMMASLYRMGLPPGAMLLNINFPGAATPSAKVHWVPLQDNRYASLFVPDGDGYVHRFQHNLHPVAQGPSDRDVVAGGNISATLISLAGLSLPAPVGFPLE